MEVKTKSIVQLKGIFLNADECKIIAKLIEVSSNCDGKTDGLDSNENVFLDEFHLAVIENNEVVNV